MFRFNTDKTECGAEILTIYGPDEHGEYAGVICTEGGDLFGVTWDKDGDEVCHPGSGAESDRDERFVLVPLSVPEALSPLKIK